jgi:hypothetical protein
MFRLWAAATAACLAGSFGVSKASAAEFESSVVLRSSSPSTSASFFTEATFPQRVNSTNAWDGAPESGLAKAIDPAARAHAYAFVEFAPASTFGAAWSPMSALTNATPTTPLRLSDSPAAVDSYVRVFEMLSRNGASGTPSGTVAQPMQ